MKNNVLNLLALLFMFSAIACSSSEGDTTLADANDSENISVEITSRSLETANSEGEDLHILLVRKWQNESGEVFLDLKIDGSFEGQLTKDEVVYGSWEMTEDRKTLKLMGDKSEEGKGNNLNITYTVLEMAIDKMKVQDEKGNEITFISPNE